MTKESAIERTACRKVRETYGVSSIKLLSQGSTGLPDRLFLVPGGRPLFIEFKRPGGELSAKQQYVCGCLRELGYRVNVCDSVDQVLMIFNLLNLTKGGTKS